MAERATRARLREAHDRKARAIESLLAAMEAFTTEAAGDMTDADIARLWDASAAEAVAALEDEP